VVDPPYQDRSWLVTYQGLSVEQAQERAAAERRPIRVLRPGDPTTADLNAGRLNLHLDSDGQLVEIRAG
jgi:hypothetical protein